MKRAVRRSMPPAAASHQQYALFGFAEELDRRPLHFVEPIPPARLCGACGLVPKLIGFLPCGHFLCKPCCEQCALAEGAVCPLDGDTFPEEDVDWREFPADNLTKRQVKCWNEANGCSAVVSVAEISQHFHRDCGHHTARCPKCSATVLWKDVCGHLRTQCSALVLCSLPESHQGAGDKVGMTSLTSFEALLEDRVTEMRAWLERLSVENDAQSDRMNLLCHNVNSLRETIKQELETAASRTSDGLARNAAAVSSVKLGVTEKCDKILGSVSAVQWHLGKSARSHQWTVKGYASLKLAAWRGGTAEQHCGRVYLRGYFVTPGVLLKKREDAVVLHLMLQIHKGEVDEFLEWPFKFEIRLSAVHPEMREVGCRLLCKPEYRLAEYYSRPIESSNLPLYFGSRFFDLRELELNSYVKNDELVLRCELLSS